MKHSRSFAAPAEKHGAALLMLRHPTDCGNPTKMLKDSWSVPLVGE